MEYIYSAEIHTKAYEYLPSTRMELRIENLKRGKEASPSPEIATQNVALTYPSTTSVY